MQAAFLEYTSRSDEKRTHTRTALPRDRRARPDRHHYHDVGDSAAPGRAHRRAVPRPHPLGAAAPAPVSSEEVRTAFYGPLTRDIAYSGFMALAPLPPGVPITADLLKRLEAQFHLQLNV